MGKQAVRYAVHSQETASVEVGFDPEFEKLTGGSGRLIYPDMFTEEKDKKLLKYWPVKNHREVASLLGVSHTTALRRYRDLKKETPAG